jgi:hypothetical protein
MTEPTPTSPPVSAAGGGLPVVATGLAAEQVLERLGKASRRGRLPGFAAGGHGALFSVAAHGSPFDADLVARYRVLASGGELGFEVRFKRVMPGIFVAALVVSAWPGVYFMDELIAMYLRELWRPWVTYYWYLPLTILPLPWVWRAVMRKSLTTTRASALEAIGKVAAEIDGVVSGVTDESQPTPR